MAMILRFVELSGFTGWLIIASIFFGVIIGCERIFVLYIVNSLAVKKTKDLVFENISCQKYSVALQICGSYKDLPFLKVIKAGVVAMDSGREAMHSALSEVITEIEAKVEERLSFLGLIANVATLLGLLGTITGLIKTFKAISAVDPSLKAELLGTGISEAMYSTGAGLMVGIAAMVLHTICSSRANAFVSEAQKTAYELLKTIEQVERKAA